MSLTSKFSPSFFLRYALKFNDLDAAEDQPLRDIRAATLDAWRNRLVAEEQQQAADLSSSLQDTSCSKQNHHHRRGSSNNVQALFLCRGGSGVSVLWEPGVEGLKREITTGSVASG